MDFPRDGRGSRPLRPALAATQTTRMRRGACELFLGALAVASCRASTPLSPRVALTYFSWWSAARRRDRRCAWRGRTDRFRSTKPRGGGTGRACRFSCNVLVLEAQAGQALLTGACRSTKQGSVGGVVNGGQSLRQTSNIPSIGLGPGFSPHAGPDQPAP